MRKTALSALALGLALAAGSAAAGTVNDEFNITLQVDAMCAIEAPAADVFMLHDPSLGNTSGQASVGFGVVCNQDLPFTLELDTAGAGLAVLHDAVIGQSVNATVKITSIDVYNPVVWGPLANGEEYSDIGTGSRQDYEIDVSYEHGRQPAVGTYTTPKTITLTF